MSSACVLPLRALGVRQGAAINALHPSHGLYTLAASLQARMIDPAAC